MLLDDLELAMENSHLLHNIQNPWFRIIISINACAKNDLQWVLVSMEQLFERVGGIQRYYGKAREAGLDI